MNQLVSKFLIFGLGVTTGTVLGILFAPDDGQSTRDRLSYQVARQRDRIGDLLASLGETELSPEQMAANSESVRVLEETRQEAQRLQSHIEALIEQVRTNPQV